MCTLVEKDFHFLWKFIEPTSYRGVTFIMKGSFFFILFIIHAFVGQGQQLNDGFRNYHLTNHSFESDTVISEPYAIVRFHYEFNEKNPGEIMQIVVSTPQSCELYKLTPSNETEVIVNRSEIEFRVENQFGIKWLYVPNHAVVQGRINHVYLKRVWIETRKEYVPEVPILQKRLEKPVIYVYSEQEKNYTLHFPSEKDIDFTYPKVKAKKWEIKANEKGEIAYDNKVYPYLFWETLQPLNVNWIEGFTVSKAHLLTFLENILAEMNFSDKEKADFISYWIPRMMQYENVDVQFLFNEAYKKDVMSIEIFPAVNAFRVFMVFRPSDGEQHLRPQKIERAIRTPEFYLEWGGAFDQTRI